MISRAINFGIWLTGVAVLAYVFFFVPVGTRTVGEHVARIWATPEARELRKDVAEAARGVATTADSQDETEREAP